MTIWHTLKHYGGILMAVAGTLCSSAGYTDGATGMQAVAPDWRSPMHPIPVGVPVADGPVVLLCHRRVGRDAAEVVQRDLGEFRPVFYGGLHDRPWQATFAAPDHVAHQGGTYPEITENTGAYIRARLRELLRDARLLCMDRDAWAVLDSADRADLRRRVETGLGLLMPMPDEEMLDDLQEWLGKPEWQSAVDVWPHLQTASAKAVSVWRTKVGRGRVSILDFRSPPWMSSVRFLVPNFGDRTLFDHGLVVMREAMEWTGGRTAGIGIRELSPPVQWSWQSTPATVRVRVNVAEACKTSLAACVTNGRGTAIYRTVKEVALAAGDNTLELSVGPVPAGEHTLYVQARGEAVAATDIQVDSPTTLAVEPSARFFAADQPVTVAVRVENSHPEDRVTLGLLDAWGREVARQDGSPNATDITLPAPFPRSRCQELRATLWRAGVPVRVVHATISRRRSLSLDQFHLFLWSGCYDHWWRNLHDARQVELGQTLAFTGNPGDVEPGYRASSAGEGDDLSFRQRYLRNATEAALRKNLQLFSLTGTHHRTLDEVVDPAVFDEDVKKLLAFAEYADRRGGIGPMSHGDELYIRGWVPKARDWRVEPARSALREYLKRRYNNDIAALNAAWETDFSDFHEFEAPDDLDRPKEPRAPWLDYCFFLEDAFCSYYKRLNAAVRQHYPDVLIGMDGMEKFSAVDGINWPRLQASQDIMIIYPHIDHVNKLFSWRAGIDFKRPGTLGGFWMAYGSDFVPDVARGYPWMALFHGLNSIGYFQSYETSDRYAALYPDWRPRTGYAAATESIREIRRGIDRMLLSAEPEYSPIAIHYSARSLALSFPDSQIGAHLNALGVYSTYRTRREGYVGHTANSGTAFTMLLSDAGYKPKFVSTQQVEAGILADYKVLVLPLSQSLTEDEVTAIEKFVRGGGMLIADYHCGVRDGNGNLYDSGGGALDRLFGLRQASGLPAHRSLTVSDFLHRPSVGRAMTGFTLDETLVPDAPALVTHVNDDEDWTAPAVHGEADGGIPVCITRPVGDGLTVYLNFSVEPYLRLRKDADGLPLRTAMNDIVQSLGQVEPVAQVVRKEAGFVEDRALDNVPEIGPWLHPFRDGDTEYLGIHWDYKRADWSEHDVLLRTNKPAHVYDVRAGRYHGFTSDVPMRIGGGAPVRLFARLPYAVSGFDIQGPSEATAGEPVALRFRVLTEADAPGSHTFRITIHDDEGNQVRALSDSVRAPRGQAVYTFVPAFDEAGRTLTINVKDVATGVAGTVRLQVKGPNL
ncbi:MAG: beta-galactosidase [Candidatus Pacebacteria bacterium]|nr:beta-galactosidase [Candidatus Paceibacterota bacterium]